MAISEQDLVPGMRFRWLRGHHPGTIEEVVKVSGTDVTVKLISRGTHGVPRGAVGPVRKSHLIANCEVVRPAKGSGRA